MLDIKMSIYENHKQLDKLCQELLRRKGQANTLTPDSFRKGHQSQLGLGGVGCSYHPIYEPVRVAVRTSSNVGSGREGMAVEGITHLPQFRSMHGDGRPAQYAQRYKGSLGNGRPSDVVLDMRQGQTLYRRLDCLGGRFPYVRGLIALEAHYQDAIPVRSDNESV